MIMSEHRYTPPRELLTFFNEFDTYLIAGHREPDGDCVGSALALASWLERRGKKIVLVSAGPFKRPEIKQYESLFIPSVDLSGCDGKTALVILDCSGIDRMGDASLGLEHLPRSIIDHHATNEGNSPADFIESSASSTTVLVQSLIETFGDTPTAAEAGFLLFGLCTDTGFFRHLDHGGALTLSAASRLLFAGASPKKTFAHINGGKSFGSRILISRILSRLTPCYGGGLMVAWENLADTAEFGLEGRDSDTLYQLIQSISGVEAIIIIRQESPDNCTVGFRSLDRIDVSRVAAQFGGGGHRQASGLSTPGTISEILPRLIEAFAADFPGIPAWKNDQPPAIT